MSTRLGIWLLASALSLAGCSSTSKNSGESTGGADAGDDASTGGGGGGSSGSGGNGGAGGCGTGCSGPTSCIAGKCQLTAFIACAGATCPLGLLPKMTSAAEACGKPDCPGASQTTVCAHPDHAFSGENVSCPSGYHEGLSVVLCGSPESTYSVCVED